MKRKLLALIGCAILAGVALANAGEARKVRVGLSWHERQSAITQAWSDYFRKYSAEYGPKHGLDFVWLEVVGNGEPAQEASNIEDLINQEVDIIVAWPNNHETIGQSILAAREHGIKFVTFDHSSANVQPDAHVGADSYDQGISTAEAFVDILKKNNVKGVCIELMGSLGDPNALARSKAWKEIEGKYGQWKTVAQVPTEWEPEKFKSGLSNALAANPEANCLFLGSDFAFASVQAALEEAGRWAKRGEPGHIYIASQDIQPQGYTAMANGYIDVGTTYDAWFHAQKLVEVLAQLANGETVPVENLVPGRVATPDNITTLENIWSRDYKD